MTAPKRIQQRRTFGWRMPRGAVSVARPTRWGNPYRIGDLVPETGEVVRDRARAVELYRELVEGDEEFARSARLELGGLDLACWCPLRDANGNPEPCHADILLQIANHREAR